MNQHGFIQLIGGVTQNLMPRPEEVEAGERQADGSCPGGTINHRVNTTLLEYAQVWGRFRSGKSISP